MPLYWKHTCDTLMEVIMFAVVVVIIRKMLECNDAFMNEALVLCKFVSQSHSFTNLLAGSVSTILRVAMQFKCRLKLFSVSEMQLMHKLRKSYLEAKFFNGKYSIFDKNHSKCSCYA